MVTNKSDLQDALTTRSSHRWRRWWPARFSLTKLFASIGVRLVAVVLITGVLAFGMIGSLTMFRFDFALREQAGALGKFSERQLAHRLDGEAQLARARMELLGADLARQLRQLAQRSDIAKAVDSKNDVTIRELLVKVTKTSGFDTLIAFDESGRVIGANTPLYLLAARTHSQMDLLAAHTHLQRFKITSALRGVLVSNNRSAPRGYEVTLELEPELLSALGLPIQLTIAHAAIEPVFDDFGDLIGAIAAFRTLARTERTLENFTSLSNTGVVILRGNEIVSAAGPENASFSEVDANADELLRSDDGAHVARCVDYETTMKVCTFTAASAVTVSRDQMFRIGAQQTGSLKSQFLASAAVTLAILVIALLIVVRHTTRGLSALASAARSVASGNMDVPFYPVGVGEIYSLALAFETMLANIRSSIGRIRQLAFYDTVTHLPNREKIQVEAPALIEKAECGMFLFLDLDGFKSINDTFGHKAGDLLLGKVAERLTMFFGKVTSDGMSAECMLARIGGDEFAAILPGIPSVEGASVIARGIIQVLRSPFELRGSQMSIGASIGITMFPSDGRSYENLMINADLAMYVAKAKGRNTFAFFTSDLAERSKTRLVLERDLKDAVRNGQLSVHYQPKVCCHDGRIQGVEALVRWEHPRLGKLPPGKFLDIAQETGLIAEIDRFVIERSLNDIGELIATGSDVVLAVNITAAEIEDPLFIGDIIRLVGKYNFPPSRLEIEITESVAMRYPEDVCKRITGLRQLGIRFAIDDFGSGYSNLAKLARLPFDTVKLDRSLIFGVSEDSEKQTIVRIALSLARELGFETVAEGVETIEDLRFVAEGGATMAQGYLFSPAVPLQEFSVLLQPKRLVRNVAASDRHQNTLQKVQLN